jgi:hypothetical protein
METSIGKGCNVGRSGADTTAISMINLEVKVLFKGRMLALHVRLEDYLILTPVTYP